MYKVEGIGQVIWKLAKSNEDITFSAINNAIKTWTDSKFDNTNAECYKLVVRVVGDAIQAGVVKRHMFESGMTFMYDPIFDSLFGNQNDPIELQLVRAMFMMIRHTQVKTSDGDILIDFGQGTV
jgi:hypothetical protein